MNILHIADYGITKNNGIAEVVNNLSLYQSRLGHEVNVILLRTPTNYQKHIVSSSCRDIINNIRKISPTIVIFHSLYKWQYPFIALFLKRSNVPYLIEMHGGSSVQNARKSKLKKAVANILLYKRFIKNSGSIIYLNNAERSLSIFDHKNIIIPNGVNLNDVVEDVVPRIDNRISFLFLGRIDFYHKGLDYLVESINKISQTRLKNQVVFKIYGQRYDDRILDIADKSEGMIEYHNPVYGNDKKKIISQTDIFILTSRYEGMPMSILEALSYGKPCLITEQTNMSDIILNNNAGWVCDLSIDDIAATIQQAYNDIRENKEQLSQNAKNAVLPFDWNQIARLSIEQYSLFV